MSSISGISNNSAMMQGINGMRAMQRPDPAKMAENLFSQLDTSGQGYLQKADLQSAFDKLATSDSSSSDSSTNVDDLFATLDTDSDGKVTQDEFTSGLKNLHDSLEQQFQDGRMQMAMQAGGMNAMGGMPPPPPPQGSDEGFTKDELSSQLDEIGSTDSARSSLISSIVQNFDKADTNSDGKVSFQEAMAYQQSTTSSTATEQTSSTSSTSSTSASSSSESNPEIKVMMQIMKLMHAYMADNSASASSTLSVSA